MPQYHRVKVASDVEVNVITSGVFDSDELNDNVVLLLHGFPDTHHLWDAQIPFLASKGYSVIAPDLPGFGDSSKPVDIHFYSTNNLARILLKVVDQLLKNEKNRAFHLVGHDWGASLSWSMAAAYPDRVRSLTVLSVGAPWTMFYLGGIRQCQLSWYMLYFLSPKAEEGLRDNNWAFFKALFNHESEESIDRYRAHASSSPEALSAMLSIYRANIDPSMFATTAVANSRSIRIRQIRCPVLGVWSDKDEALTEEQMKGSGALSVKGLWRYEKIENCNHWIPRNAAERLNALLLEFLHGTQMSKL